MASANKISTVNKKMETKVSKKEAVEECTVCCEAYNKSSRARVDCERAGCNYKACTECVRAYLLSSVNEPHCMDCKTNWSAKFMLILKKTWLNDTYRPHREKFLCDLELSKIAETMPAAERYQAVKKQEKVTHELRSEYFAMKLELEKIGAKVNESARLTQQIKHGIPDPKAEKKEFFMPCPAVNCNGLLSTQYKCGICEMFTCHECHEVLGLSKTEHTHVCDANNVASALAIKKETRQCPGCHNRIYRVEGCSQMWCTGCHTAFDWNTGRKVSTQGLHNPHWFEYQRSLNGGAAPRTPGDVPCGGLCTRSQVNTGIVARLVSLKRATTPLSLNPQSDKLAETLRYIHRIVENITHNDVRETRQRIQGLRDFTEQRVKYIVGEMTKEELSTYIFRSDKTRQKNTELLNVFELLSAVGIDLFNRLIDNPNTGEDYLQEVIEQVAQYDKLRVYCNGLFGAISNTYSMTVPQITENWVRLTEKFNSKSLKMIDACKTEVKKEDWLHTNLANDDALEKIMKTGVTGDFLITTTEKTDEYLLYVVFKNKPTKHLIKKAEECFHINRLPLSLVTTLEDLVTTLKKPYPNWPVLLGRPIAPETLAPESVV